jgi:hypothetical protein
MLGRAQQIGFLFFFFVFLRVLRGCNEVQRSPSTLLRAVSLSNGRWTFYEVVKKIIA